MHYIIYAFGYNIIVYFLIILYNYYIYIKFVYAILPHRRHYCDSVTHADRSIYCG